MYVELDGIDVNETLQASQEKSASASSLGGRPHLMQTKSYKTRRRDILCFRYGFIQKGDDLASTLTWS